MPKEETETTKEVAMQKEETPQTEIDRLKEENEKLKQENKKILKMLEATLAFCERVRHSRVGKMFFHKELKEVSFDREETISR